ncbi:MAG: EAL domain-containing protein [Methylococcaceae bacterium]|nr:EAL domain-containing protein [Methylococcaceae bacterium]
MIRTQPSPLHVLIVEDADDDALLLVDYLRLEGYTLDWQQVDSEADLIAALKQPRDIIFSNYSMPGLNGVRVLEIVRRHDPEVPFIFVSGTIGEDLAVRSLKSGAQDFVLKGQMHRLAPTVDRELRDVRARRERRQAEQMLRKLSLVVKQAADSVFITDPSGCIEYVNPAFEKLTGYSAKEVKGATPAVLRSGLYDNEYYERLWKTIRRGEVFTGTLINRRKNGEMFYEEKVITPLKDEQGRITHYVSTGRDITARVHAEEARSRLAAVLEATPDMVAILEPRGYLRYLNRAGRRLLGLKPDENIEGRGLNDMFPEPVVRHLVADILSAEQPDDVWTGETVLMTANGSNVPVSLVLLAHPGANGEIGYFSTIARDISERKHFEASIQYKATHDGLTDLPNRYLLIDRFQSALERARRRASCVAVLFLDLNNFKRVNDTLGHAAGDSLLQQVARRLRSCLRPNDTVARHGGDEFTILVEDLASAENVTAVLRKLGSAFERPVIIGTQEVYVTFSTGIALYPHDGDRVDDLLRHADTAMYQAKSSGSGQYRFYAPDMNARGHEFLALEADLRRALERNEFLLHYQPQVDLHSGQLAGVEGLIRWRHPLRGLVSPVDFVSLLENSGLITSIGEWVLRQACIQHRDLREAGFQDHRIAINVSAAQFNDEDLLDKVRRALQDERMPAQSLELEITENVVMQDPVNAAEVLQALRVLGVRTAVDDFGTGYSSLAYLKRFPLNVLKIDKTFVGDIGRDHGDAAIVEASISLAHKLGLEIVAEGVETREQLEFLRHRDCDLAQGYYLSRPLAGTDLLASLRKVSARSRSYLSRSAGH